MLGTGGAFWLAVIGIICTSTWVCICASSSPNWLLLDHMVKSQFHACEVIICHRRNLQVLCLSENRYNMGRGSTSFCLNSSWPLLETVTGREHSIADRALAYKSGDLGSIPEVANDLLSDLGHLVFPLCACFPSCPVSVWSIWIGSSSNWRLSLITFVPCPAQWVPISLRGPRHYHNEQ